jgi:peptidoglycan/xylan/chitin deacetylase (PgdA/CDA1 family)
MSPHEGHRRRFASNQALHRRRRRIAFATLVAIVAVPTLVLTAFQGSDSGPVDWSGGKLRRGMQALVGPAGQRTAVERLIRLGLPVYCAGTEGRYVALTFDDGPSEHTPRFYDLLRAAGARATFFIVGANMGSPTFAAYARRVAEIGALGDHTWLHTALAGLPEETILDEVSRTKRAIVKTTAAPVLVFRPPFASRDETVQRIVGAQRMLTVLWNTDSRDWAGVGWRQIAANVVRGLEPGSIVLMHDTRPETLKALQRVILPELGRRGLRAVTLPELLALDPPTEAQLREDASRGRCTRGHYEGDAKLPARTAVTSSPRRR